MAAMKAKLLVWWKKVSSVPSVGSPLNIVCLILNIVFPGSGTIVAGIVGKDGAQFLVGILQFVLCIGIIGWIWSIYWGWLIFKKG